MRARSPSAACIAAMLSQRVGRVQRHLDPGDAGVDERGGGLDGARGLEPAQDGDQAAGHGAALSARSWAWAAARPASVISVASSVRASSPHERERGAVGGGQRGRADQHDVAAEPVGPRAGELGADQQAREPRAGALGRRGRRAAPRRGCRRGGPARRSGRASVSSTASAKSALGPALGGDGMAQHRGGRRAARRARRS